MPITPQTLGVMLAGAILGPWLGALSVTVLLALVAVGLPLLAGGRGGFAVFVGPTVGYMLGWILGAIVIGLVVRIGGRIHWTTTIAGLLLGGIVAIYAVGVPFVALIVRIPLDAAAISSIAFIPGDLIKVAIATVVVLTLWRAYPRAFRLAPRPAPATTAVPVIADGQA